MNRTTVDGEQLRAAREAKRWSLVTQQEIAAELGTTRARIIDFEVWGKPLPRGLTLKDALAAIEAIQQRRASEDESGQRVG